LHDLRHSYATWLVYSGVPVNEVAETMGHSRSSTTLNRCTHVPGKTCHSKVRKALVDLSLAPRSEDDHK
jgi:integrase